MDEGQPRLSGGNACRRRPYNKTHLLKTSLRLWFEEYLPGIEEFLCDTLANESLSVFAEQRRLFFLERLDIVKLPPTVPPREGRNLSQELLKDTEEKSGIPSSQHPKLAPLPDFAATQREIARSLAGSTNGHVIEDKEDDGDGDDDSLEKVKVYDDIDLGDLSSKEDEDDLKSSENPYDDEDIDNIPESKIPAASPIHIHKDDDDGEDQEEENDYEIPVAMQQLSENGTGSHPCIPSALSLEDLHDDALDSPSIMGPPPIPPPLPPRRDIRFSDSGSRSSINALAEVAPPDLPYRPPLPRRSEICGRSERSDRSDPDLSADGGSTSYESFDDDDDHNLNTSGNNNTTEARTARVKLPAKPKRKKPTLKMSKKLSKSRSQSQLEIIAPFRKLDKVDLSGEVMHKGKLTWNRRVFAITTGCLAMYKPEKDGRPLLVIPLTGYEAMVNDRKEGRRGFEIKMTHPQDDTHIFSVDVKDWAYTWKDHINNQSRGRPSPIGRPIHLSRTLSSDPSHTATPCPSTTLPQAILGSNGSTAAPNASPRSSTMPHAARNSTSTQGSKQLNSNGITWMEEDGYDEINVRDNNGNIFFEEEEGEEEDENENQRGIFDENSSVISETISTQSTSSPILTRYSKFRLSRSKDFNASVKSTPEERNIQKKGDTISEILRRRKKQFQAKLSASALPNPAQLLRPAASTMSLTRLHWKSVLYNWSTPLDQVIMTLRRTDLHASNSNVSTASEGGGGGEEAVLRPRRAGGKVMRMGSFAFRATQFFENISKKTSVKRKLSTPSFSSDDRPSKPRVVSAYIPKSSGSANDENNPGNIMEESSMSSSSTGNLQQTLFHTPTSDNSIPAFSDSTSIPSAPNSPDEVFLCDFTDSNKETRRGIGSKDVDVISLDDQNNLQNVLHKGYLFIFSTFNRKRWGKRWCLVRDNAFECYRGENEPVTRCELSFLLKTCVLKRAVMETNSEFGLMLVEQEKGKERIKIEPISPADMPGWVQVLMAETSTESIPEGLEEHMKPQVIRRGSDAPSLLSLTVLKQWDMDITFQSLMSAKEPSPEEKDPDWIVPFDSKGSLHEHSEKCLTSGPESSEAGTSLTVMESNSSSAVDSAVSHVKKKHTTDSGFYSVKGNNSDSDGEHVEGFNLSIAVEGEEEKELFKDLSVLESHTHHSKELLSNETSRPSLGNDEAFQVTHSPTTCQTPSNVVLELCECDPDQSMSSNACPSSSNAPSISSPSLNSISVSSNQNPTIPTVAPSPHLHPFHEIKNSSTHDQNKAIPLDAPNTAKNESECGDEYSQVLKRSDRRKTSDLKCEKLTPDASSVDTLLFPDMLVFGGINPEEDLSEKEIPPKESIYEDIDDSSDGRSSKTLSVNDIDLSGEVQKLDIIDPEDTNNLKVSLNSQNTTILEVSQNPNQQSSSDMLEADGNNSVTSTIVELLNNDGKTKEDNSLSTESSKQISYEGQISEGIFTSLIPMSITPIPLADKTNEVSKMTSDHSLSSSKSHKPELPLVEVHKPGMTEDELKEAIDRLKKKKAQLKRKRLAVHDKRQRVSNDEEGLACEKEFASLEREVESTDKDIGFLQNQLDALCLQSLEAIKINVQNNSAAKKRRSKKKGQ